MVPAISSDFERYSREQKEQARVKSPSSKTDWKTLDGSNHLDSTGGPSTIDSVRDSASLAALGAWDRHEFDWPVPSANTFQLTPDRITL
jgi:hypothetical protein